MPDSPSEPPDRRTRRVAALGAATLLVLLAACGKEPAPRQEAIRPVRTVVVQAQPGETALEWPGEVRPRIETRYGFRVGGKLAARLVSVGDRVKPGQVLARLDPQDVAPQIAAQQAQLEAARTELKLAQIDLGRLRDLRERQFVAQAQVDRQQALVDGAASKVDAVKAQLDTARNAATFQTLMADVAGVVVAVDAEAGQVVAAGQSVVRVAQVRERDVVVNVPERDMAQARRIERWQVLLPIRPDEPIPAKVREIAPLADPASRTFAVRLTLQADAPGAEWGMSAVVRAVGASQPQFRLPLSVLWSKDGRPHVWRLDTKQNTVQPVPVETAGFTDDGVIVRSGVSAGDVIVTAGANLLVPGQTVKRLAGATP